MGTLANLELEVGALTLTVGTVSDVADSAAAAAAANLLSIHSHDDEFLDVHVALTLGIVERGALDSRVIAIENILGLWGDFNPYDDGAIWGAYTSLQATVGILDHDITAQIIATNDLISLRFDEAISYADGRYSAMQTYIDVISGQITLGVETQITDHWNIAASVLQSAILNITDSDISLAVGNLQTWTDGQIANNYSSLVVYADGIVGAVQSDLTDLTGTVTTNRSTIEARATSIELSVTSVEDDVYSNSANITIYNNSVESYATALNLLTGELAAVWSILGVGGIEIAAIESNVESIDTQLQSLELTDISGLSTALEGISATLDDHEYLLGSFYLQTATSFNLVVTETSGSGVVMGGVTASLIPHWFEGRTYGIGAQVIHSGYLYTCAIAHDNLVTTHTPGVATTYWTQGAAENGQTSVVVSADSFAVRGSTADVEPFSIVGNAISFNGGVSFANVTGATKPANNATVGATWGVDVNSQPTSLSGINSTEGSKLSGIAAGADVTAANTAANTNYVGAVLASKIAGWAYGGDTTYVNGGSIFTETITLGKIYGASGSLTLSGTGKLTVNGGSIEIKSAAGVNVTAGSVDFKVGTDLNMYATTGNSAMLNFYTNYAVAPNLRGSIYASHGNAYLNITGADLNINASNSINISATANIDIYGSNINIQVPSQIELVSSAGGYIAVNSVVEIESVVFSGAAISGVSTLAMSGALSGATTISASSTISTTGGHVTAANGAVGMYSGISTRFVSDAPGSTSSYWAIVGRDSGSGNVFYVRGDGQVWCANGVWFTSDIQAKHDIKSIDEMVSGKLLALPAKRFTKNGSVTEESGFMAQDLQIAMPEAVREFKHPDKTMHDGEKEVVLLEGKTELAIKDGPILAYLVKWGQEQQEMIDALSSRIEDLEKQTVLEIK